MLQAIDINEGHNGQWRSQDLHMEGVGEAPRAPEAVLGVGPGGGRPLPEGGSGVSPPRKF
jgi:hypothetical protein